MGSATTQQEVEKLVYQARQEMERVSVQPKLFVSEGDSFIEQAFAMLNNASSRTLGPEVTFGRINDYMGFGNRAEEFFRHLVVSRLAFPLSKLKTVEYLYRYQGMSLDIDAVYRF